MPPGHQHMPDMNAPMNTEQHAMDAAEIHQASGTGVNPRSAPMEMIHKRAGDWTLMFHGIGFLADIQQTGPRGRDKLVAPNWFMGTAEHTLSGGTVEFRSMISLDPATITKRRYPLLFQTGETAYGKPVVDGQHPHDFLMELSAQYSHPIAESTSLLLYFAPVGDPALGPVAFPHRVSAMEIPQATLAHHLQDSTHIANEVFTAGLLRHMFRIEASGFHGAEPNENRWNIDYGTIDSWSARLTLTPGANWTAQASLGRLAHPEAAEPGDIVRATASVTYNRPLAAGNWATSLVWGRNHKTAEQRNLNSFLAESVLRFRHKNYVTGRVELVDKDELLNDRPEIRQHLDATIGSVFRITAYTAGYTRDIGLVSWLETGLGANFTFYAIPSAIQPYYGSHPVGFVVFLRARLKGGEHTMQNMPNMQHMHHGS